MDAVNATEKLLSIDYKQFIIVLITILVAVLILKKFFNEFMKIFNIETTTARKERERKEEINYIKNQLDNLQSHQEKIQAAAILADQKIDERMDNLEAMLYSHVQASMRSTLWRIYQDSKEAKYITREGLKTFLECGKVYESAGGDDIYHDKLYPEVMELEVRDE